MKKSLLTILSLIPFILRAQVIITMAGNGAAGFSGDGGPATAAELNQPTPVYARGGNLFIGDNNNVRIRKVDTNGIISTICGNGTVGYSSDGLPAIYAEITGVTDFTTDSIGNLYFTDAGNNCIREIDTAGIINTVVGTGIAGYNGDGGHADSAELNQPSGIVFDKKGNLYIYDYMNYRIRKVDTAGIITTVAGTGTAGFSPDGSLADTAMLSGEIDIRIDRQGSLFFGDNNRIRRIDTSGVLTTVAGNGVLGYSGNGVEATTAEIAASVIILDTSGNMFIGDGASNTIRKVDTGGIITTIAGNGSTGYSGDGGAPLLATLCLPQGIALDLKGNMYIGDECNNRVRKITLDTPSSVNNVNNQQQSLNIAPNPCKGFFTALLSSTVNEDYDLIVTGISGAQLMKIQCTANRQTVINTDLPPGIYFINAITPQQRFTQKLTIL